jgi:hypothetical protein
MKLKLLTALAGLQQLSVTSKFPKPSISPPPRLAVNPAGMPVTASPVVLPTMLNPKIPSFPLP